jgi:hypothetical protein
LRTLLLLHPLQPPLQFAPRLAFPLRAVTPNVTV